MINLKDCIEIGQLTRPHGIKGHLIVKLNGFTFDDLEEMELVFIIIDGLPVPFFIEEFSERNSDSLLLKLDAVDSGEEARQYAEATIYIPNNQLSGTQDHSVNPKLLKGYRVVDETKGDIGIFDDLLDFDQNPVFSVLNHKQEILIPYNEAFITSIDNDLKVIHVNCPDGLLELYM